MDDFQVFIEVRSEGIEPDVQPGDRWLSTDDGLVREWDGRRWVDPTTGEPCGD